jgi:chaperone modulatory protein CbpM
MNKQHIIISNITVEENPELTLDELCSACGITPHFIHELIEFGALDCEDVALEIYRFQPEQLRRVRTIVHLHHDLEINIPGAALAVELMEEMERMRAKIEMLEKNLFFNK